MTGAPDAPGPPGEQPPAPRPDHPRATTVLVLGILGLAACGLLAPVAWVMGGRVLAEIDASHGYLGGRGTAQAGWVLGIVGSVLLGLGVLFAVVMLALFAILGVATYRT